MVPALDIWDTQPDDYDDYYTNYEREQNKTTTSQGGTIKDDHVPSELSELSTDLVSDGPEKFANNLTPPVALSATSSHAFWIQLRPERMGRNGLELRKDHF